MAPLSRFAPSPRGDDGLCCGAALAGRPRDGAAPVSHARGARGFTLVELLLAIAVMSLLAILSWRGLDGMVRAQEITRQRADEMLVLQAALGQWGTDLDALMPIANTTPLDWDGQVLRITRRSSAVPDEGALVVAWTVRGAQGAGRWMRWQSPPVRTRAEWQEAWQLAGQWARSPGEAERRYETTLLPLENWQIFYYRGGAWSNALSSSGAGSGNSTAIPDGVRLQITLPPGQALVGRLTRDWVSPVLGGGRT
ncbi:PulJ/GspJ family protein [Acidovorax sp. LjRoot129]|uniref:PulJ/GspJ family protein n=1 Tax=Acidovorax sp. LjRoot129 TaxID=3342260 RepID=UPI003F4F5213